MISLTAVCSIVKGSGCMNNVTACVAPVDIYIKANM
jgi:hypothetical protein